MTHLIMTRRLALNLCAAVGLTTFHSVRAAPRPARLLVGFGAGSGIDVAARALAGEMTDYADPLQVENRPGAAERLAIDALLAAPADGATLLFTGSSPLAVLPHAYRKLAYDPLRDLMPLSPVCSFPFALTVGPAVPESVRTLSDFIGWCRANPAQSSYGNVGAGTPHHFIGFMLARAANIDFTHVPYQGVAAVNDLLGGRLAATVLAVGTTVQHVKAGKARMLAVSGPRRSALLPDVPTFAESGFPQIQVQDWFGVFGPARVPSSVAAEVHRSVQRALGSEPMKAALARLSFEPYAGTPTEFAERVRTDHARWAPVVRDAGFRIED